MRCATMVPMDPLVAAFKAGDDAAIRSVIARHGGAIQTVARSMVHSDDLVAEVVQQTFVKAWKASSTFDESRELAPWLYSIARRTAIDVLRREGRAPTATADDQLDQAVTPLSFDRTWEIYEVRTALDQLPEDERTVLKLSYMTGLTHEQIAAELGVPVGTVKSRSGRARKRLAKILGHLNPDANRTVTSDVQGGE